MKFLFLTLAFLLPFDVLVANDKLNEKEREELVSSLDNICPDTWCGGDLNYHIKDLQCLNGGDSCKIWISAQAYEIEDYVFPEEYFSCDLRDLKYKNDILRVSFGKVQYTEKLYDKVTQCIQKEIAPLMLPITIPPKKLSAQTCIELIVDRPRAANFFTDFDFSQGSLRRFGATFFQKAQAKLSMRTGCQSIPTPSFSCEAFERGTPVCAANIENYSIIIAKDYVDEARLLVFRRNLKSDLTVPAISEEFNDEVLFLPDTGNCYTGLLGGNNDSQVHTLDFSAYLPSADKRFLMAQTLRDLVKKIALGTEKRDCTYRSIERSILDANCKHLGNTEIEACLLVSGGNGYLHYIFSPESSKTQIIFNRYD